MELDGVALMDAGEIPAVEVKCGGGLHRVAGVFSADGTFDIFCEDHNSGSLVLAVLGGQKSACHLMVEELKGVSQRLGLPLDEVVEWYGYKFTQSTMRAWCKCGGPKVAARWVDAGASPGEVRVLHRLGVKSVEDYLLWQKGWQQGSSLDLRVVRELVEQGVRSGAEALAWRQAGLVRPAQLAMWRARGVDTPEKLMRRTLKDRSEAVRVRA